MEDDYIDKVLKGILESPSDERVRPSDVMDMRSRLRIEKARRRRNGFLWLFLPLGLLSVLLGAFFAHKKYNDLNTQIVNLQEKLNITLIDTIVEKHVTYKFDTIHTVIYRQHYAPGATSINSDLLKEYETLAFQNKLNTLNQFLPKGIFNKYSERFLPWSLDKRGLSLLLPAASSSFHSTSAHYNNPQNSNALTNNSQDYRRFGLFDPVDPYALSPLVSSPFTEEFSILDEYLNEPGFGNPSPLYQLVPIGFNAKAHGSPIIIPTDNFGGYGFIAGLRGELDFVKNRSLSLGVEYLNRNFETKDLNIFSQFPLITGSDPQDVLFELKPNLSYLQIPLIFTQRFFTAKKLSPQVQVGMVAYKTIKNEIIYEFLGDAGEYYLPATYNTGTFSFDNIRLGIGARYKLGPKFSIESNLQYQHAFSTRPEDFTALRYFNWDLSFNYNFSKSLN